MGTVKIVKVVKALIAIGYPGIGKTIASHRDHGVHRESSRNQNNYYPQITRIYADFLEEFKINIICEICG